MRTITQEIQVYKFEELSEEVQEKVMERQLTELENMWSPDWIREDLTFEAQMLGIDIKQIYFRGFWSQGDGACFEGDYNYRPKAIEAVRRNGSSETVTAIAERLQALQKKHFYQLRAKVTHSGHYYHEYMTDIEIDRWDGKEVSEDAEAELKDILRDFMRYSYKCLEADYYAYVTEENALEHIENNEYEFTAEGDIA